MQFLDFIDALPALTIHAADREALGRAERFVKKYEDQSLTLADAHGLVVMTDRRSAACWSTDRHLTLTGIRLVTD